MIFILGGSLVVLVGIPLSLVPAWPFAVAGVCAAALYGAGVLADSRGPAVVAGALMLVTYAAALWTSAAPVRAESAVAFGLALSFACDSAEFLRRSRGAKVFPGAIVHRLRFYGWQSLATVAATIVLMVVAELTSRAAPELWRPILLGSGSIFALAGILQGYRSARTLYGSRGVG